MDDALVTLPSRLVHVASFPDGTEFIEISGGRFIATHPDHPSAEVSARGVAFLLPLETAGAEKWWW